MRHVEKARVSTDNKFITVENTEDVKGTAPIVKFTIQSDPVSEVGVNGCQATDILEYVNNLFKSLNESFPCRENALTITKIEEALHWQYARNRDREKRNVEGKNLN